MRGPKQQIISHRREDKWWVCKMECGHEIHRRVKWRYWGTVAERHMDPAPIWAYCEHCHTKVTGGAE